MHFYTKKIATFPVISHIRTYLILLIRSLFLPHFISFYRNGTPKGRRKIRRGSGRDVPQSFQEMDAGLWREVDPTVS